MRFKNILIGLVLMLLFCPVLSNAANFYVESDGDNANDGSDNTSSDAWATIQYAIDHDDVEDGDTIYIGEGTFEENITVDKDITLYGDGSGVTIISASNSDEHVITLSEQGVILYGLGISGSNSSGIAGIYIGSDSGDSYIRGCKITDSEYGIYLEDSDGNTIGGSSSYDNDIEDNTYGIYVYYCNDTEIAYNDFTDNTYGIYLHDSEIDDIHNNDFDGGNYGIVLGSDDDYYDDDDIDTLEDDNDFSDVSDENVSLEDNENSCFISSASSLKIMKGIQKTAMEIAEKLF